MKEKAKVIYSLSFLLPIFVLFVGFIFLHIFPLGSRSFLYWDTNYQHINFLSYFKSIFTTNNDFFYSFANLGGNNMLDFSAYYNYFSPLNIILFLFPDKYINIALELIMLIKIGLCGLTFSYFLTKEVKESYLSIIFALSYALSMHTLITTMTNVVLMDGIILLPLVIVGISHIVEKNDYRLYLISLFLSVLTNAYMGYVNIVFSFFYFIYKLILVKHESIKHYLNPIRKYIFSTAIAIGLNAWLLLSIYFNIQSGKYEYFNIFDRLFLIRADITGIISKFFTARLAEGVFYDDIYPYLFSGILIFVLIILYFFNSSYSKKEKITDFVFFSFLFTGFFLNCLFVLWSMGVENPNGSIYRYSYIQIFFFIYLAYKAFINIKDIKPVFIIITAFLLAIIITVVNLKYNCIASPVFCVDIAVILLLLILFFCVVKFQQKPIYKYGLILILLIHSVNLTYNTYFVWESQKRCLTYYNISNFIDYVDIGKKVVSYIKNIDDGFYRIETQTQFVDNKNSFYNNSSLLLNYNSVSHYGSFGSPALKEFYRNIGYLNLFDTNIGVSYRDTMPLYPLMFMGVKYIFSEDELTEPYEKIEYIVDKDRKINIYKNPYCLPIAFMVDYNPNLYNDINFETTPQYINMMVKMISNQDFGDIYNELKTVNLIDSEILKSDNYILNYKNNEQNNRLYLGIYNLKKYTDHPVYSIVYNNEDIKTYNFMSQFQTIKLPEVADGADINIKLMFNEKIYNIDRYLVSIIKENIDILEKYYNELSKFPCSIEKISSSHLKGKIDVSGQDKLMLLSIPYDEGWKIKIDGKQRNAIKLFNAIMAIPVSSGDKEIEMKYIPRGFINGLIISLISIFILIFNILINRKKK